MVRSQPETDLVRDRWICHLARSRSGTFWLSGSAGVARRIPDPPARDLRRRSVALRAVRGRPPLGSDHEESEPRALIIASAEGPGATAHSQSERRQARTASTAFGPRSNMPLGSASP